MREVGTQSRPHFTDEIQPSRITSRRQLSGYICTKIDVVDNNYGHDNDQIMMIESVKTTSI